jgi:hypothetical protein
MEPEGYIVNYEAVQQVKDVPKGITLWWHM